MKYLFTTGLSLFLICSTANSRVDDIKNESPLEFFNNFQKFTGSNVNVDSAFFYVKKLASNKKFEVLLHTLLHNSFAQIFIDVNPKLETDPTKASARNEQILLSKAILSKIEADTTSLLKEVAGPIILWIKAKANANNTPLLKMLATEFMANNLQPSTFYVNKNGRYGLLIYKIINQQAGLKPLATQMLNLIKNNLKNNQKTASELTARPDFEKRAWYRYLYAYVCDYESSITNNTLQKQALLKTAFDFSPDLTDKNFSTAYFYDIAFLGGKKTFEDSYLTFLINNTTDKKQVIQTLLKIALIEPKYKGKLQDFYTTNNVTTTNFTDFWNESIETKAEISPSISVNQIDGKPFSSKELLGKWILIDFWGTWCGPCRAEHPDLQKFYEQVVLLNPNKIALLTLACKDTEEKVVQYTKEKKYSFPVAMSDGNFETDFKVQGYPTKILITPKGKYITVPFNIDFAGFIRRYIDL